MKLGPVEQRQFLLDLFCPDRSRSQHAIGALEDADWKMIMAMAKQHRLEPLLHWNLRNLKSPLPEAVRSIWSGAFQASALRALILQRELVFVHRILKDNGIPHMFLKGAYVAFHAYPHPALRPLRDIDVLVPQGREVDSYRCLLAQGCRRMKNYQSEPESALAIGLQHLPPMWSPNRQVALEVHGLMFRADMKRERPELSADALFWRRCLEANIAGARVPFPCVIDTLLHLIVHAVYDHHLDNGPLVLSDIAFLVDTHEIDWSAFWRLADRMQRTRGAVLVLKLTEHYWGNKNIDYSPACEPVADVPDELLRSAGLLTLQNLDMRGEMKFMKDMARNQSIAQRARLIWSIMFKSRETLAAMFSGHESESLWRRMLQLPGVWWRLATSKAPAYLRLRRQAHVRRELRDLDDLTLWLDQ